MRYVIIVVFEKPGRKVSSFITGSMKTIQYPGFPGVFRIEKSPVHSLVSTLSYLVFYVLDPGTGLPSD